MNYNVIDYPDFQLVKLSDYNYKKYINDRRFNKSRRTIMCISPSWHKSVNPLTIATKYKSDPKIKVVILANTLSELEYYETNDVADVIYCNNNSFIDRDVFNYIPYTVNKYDLVINSCYNSYKNVKYGSLCSNVAHIGYYNGENNYNFPKFGTYLNFETSVYNKKNYKPLTSSEIATVVNQSRTGGIFSTCEGACRASSEYLLCGTPVVSTRSEGGRDVWYTESNSIICDNDPKNVKECVTYIKDNSEKYDPITIRKTHIMMSDDHISRLAKYIFDETGITVTYNDIKHREFSPYIS